MALKELRTYLIFFGYVKVSKDDTNPLHFYDIGELSKEELELFDGYKKVNKRNMKKALNGGFKGKKFDMERLMYYD